MSPECQPGQRFAWQYPVPPRAAVPQRYHDRIAGDITELEGTRVRCSVQAWDEAARVCEGIHEPCVADTQQLNQRVANKRRAYAEGAP